MLCVFGFNSLEHDTEFAIAVMGSLIGGFLGALLAAALIVDIHKRSGLEIKIDSSQER